MEISDLFSLNYYFSHSSLSTTSFMDGYFFYWGISLLILGIIYAIIQKFFLKKSKFKKATKNYPSVLIWFGIIALLLTWFRYEHLPYLSLRFWWIIYDLVLLIFIIKHAINIKRNQSVIVKHVQKTGNEKDKYLKELKARKKKRK